MLFDIGHQLALVGQRQDFNVILLTLRWKDDVNLVSGQQAVFGPITENHLENHQNIPDRLLTEA